MNRHEAEADDGGYRPDLVTINNDGKRFLSKSVFASKASDEVLKSGTFWRLSTMIANDLPFIRPIRMRKARVLSRAPMVMQSMNHFISVFLRLNFDPAAPRVTC